jgi:hypothetical protein
VNMVVRGCLVGRDIDIAYFLSEAVDCEFASIDRLFAGYQGLC